METRVSLQYFVTDVLWKTFVAPNLPQTSQNLIYLAILVILMFSTLFKSKFRAIKL